MAVELAQEIDINLLQPRPRNVEIYGEEDVLALIKKHSRVNEIG